MLLCFPLQAVIAAVFPVAGSNPSCVSRCRQQEKDLLACDLLEKEQLVESLNRELREMQEFNDLERDFKNESIMERVSMRIECIGLFYIFS